MWLEVRPTNCNSYCIGTVYRPPSSDVAFVEKLEENIENVSTCTEKIIITGDVN